MSALVLLAALSQLGTSNPVALSPKLSPAAVHSITTSAPLSKIAATQVNQPTNTGTILEQGIKLYQSENFAEAVKVLQQASAEFQSQGNHLNQALALNYLALAQQQLGQLPEAKKAIADSLALLKIGSKNTESKEYLLIRAQALNTQGQLQLASGQSKEALTSWEGATAAYTKIKDDAGRIGSQLNQTQALQALGLYRRARITLTQVNQILQKQPDSQIKATGLLSLGNTLRVVGDLNHTNSKAKEIDKLGSQQVLEQSLAVATKVSPQLVPEIQLSLGNTAQAQQQKAQALNYYQQAATSASPITRLQAQLNQMRLLIEQKEWAQAQALWPQIQSQFATLPPSRKSVYAQINFAQSLTCLKQRTEKSEMAINVNCPRQETEEEQQTKQVKNQDAKLAESSSQNPSWTMIAKVIATAVDQAKSLDDLRAEAYALGTLGGLYEQTQQWSDAQKLTQQALKLAEGTEARDIAYRWHWQLGRILKAENNPQRNQQGAIAAYTKSVDILKALRSDLVAINRDVQFSFQEGVEPVYRELVSLLLEDETSQDNLDKARNVIESLQLAELDNFFRRACLDAKPVQIDQIDRTAAVIYPVILRDRLEVIVSLPNNSAQEKQNSPKQTKTEFLRSQPIRLSQAEIDDTIDKLRQEIVTRPTREFVPLATKVYDWLIRPIEAELANRKVKNLVFVLDGSLRSIPMAALYDGKQYLIEKGYNIALTPGLHLLPPRSLTRNKLRTIAAGITVGREPDFEELPRVKDELNQIKQEVSSRVLLNNEFTTKAIEDSVKSFPAPVVHLATHGQFSSKAEDTFILTWDNNVNVNQLSSLLQSRETNRRGAIELLVLSACKTATGDRRAGLGIAGVAVRSGARSTLATLWTVDDEATAALMGEFYKEFADVKLTKAEALKRAQLNLLSNPLYRHPYYWAPYVLVGNWL